MDLSQAIECASAFVFPGFLADDASLAAERSKNEEALAVLRDAWSSAEPGHEPFGYDLIMSLADRNRDVCDRYGIERLRDASSPNLARKLSDADLVCACATLQHRPVEQVAALAGQGAADLNVAYVDAPVSGMVMGIDIETTDRDPARGYIINVGWEIMDLTSDAVPHDAEAHYCGLPDIYRGEDVPLSNIHHITWDDIDGKTPFRENKELQKQLLKLMKKYPYMAHNAAFEDSWFKIHLDGYAEARRAGKIIVIDSRQICRSLDADVRSLPRESAPAALENWARRRGTLAADANEQHLGLDDTDLMLRTVQAEFNLKNLFAK